MKTVNYPKIKIGIVDNENIYLSPPSWDCGWYWGFGYLVNKNCHYHVDSLTRNENVDLYDAFKKHFGKSLIVRDSQLWTLVELFKTFYILKETTEVLGRGGWHYTTNPVKEIITNKEETKRINEIVLPAIFDAIYQILIPSLENDKINKELVKLVLLGDTSKVIDFMLEYNIHTDDLSAIDGLTSYDINNTHTYYWTRYHSNKK